MILSNVDRASFAHSNRKLGVAFDAIYTAEDIGSYKPDPRNFAYLLERLAERGIAKAEILHTAESLYHDHVPARRAGLATCWIHRRAGQGRPRRDPLAGGRGDAPTSASPRSPRWRGRTGRRSSAEETKTMSRHLIAALWVIAAALGAAGAFAQDSAPADEESAMDIVATTVRSQGYPCEQPKRAVRDEAELVAGPGRLGARVRARQISDQVRQRRARPDHAARLSAGPPLLAGASRCNGTGTRSLARDPVSTCSCTKKESFSACRP